MLKQLSCRQRVIVHCGGCGCHGYCARCGGTSLRERTVSRTLLWRSYTGLDQDHVITTNKVHGPHHYHPSRVIIASARSLPLVVHHLLTHGTVVPFPTDSPCVLLGQLGGSHHTCSLSVPVSSVLNHSVSYDSFLCYLAILARTWRSWLLLLLAPSSLPSSVTADDLPSGSLAAIDNHYASSLCPSILCHTSIYLAIWLTYRAILALDFSHCSLQVARHRPLPLTPILLDCKRPGPIPMKDQQSRAQSARPMILLPII